VIAGTMEPKPDDPSQLADEPIKTVPTTDEAQLALVTSPGDAARDPEPETTGSISAPAPTTETAVPETEFSGSDFDEICN
jgi:hypothetical protein